HCVGATQIGIIGGSGLDDPDILEGRTERYVETPYGKLFLISFHTFSTLGQINELNRNKVINLTSLSVFIFLSWKPNLLFFFFGRTTKRSQTLYDGQPTSPPGVCHIPMAEPFCNKTREVLVEVARSLGVKCHVRGTMLTIEGPRFSSRAESLMFRQWGADVINMTTVPEAVLAKEAGLCYASIAMATDYDCWKEHEEAVCVDNVLKTMKENANKASSILLTAIPQISQMDWAQTINTLKSMAQSSVMIPKH
uniref:Methylthioadenosine phosphorylase n=1 Tax=Neolamprologus brichardi TaxID=32507 RepID=A0A3Q4H9T8_NEOBR